MTNPNQTAMSTEVVTESTETLKDRTVEPLAGLSDLESAAKKSKGDDPPVYALDKDV